MRTQTTKRTRSEKALSVSLALALALSLAGFGAVGVAEATGTAAPSESSDAPSALADEGSGAGEALEPGEEGSSESAGAGQGESAGAEQTEAAGTEQTESAGSDEPAPEGQPQDGTDPNASEGLAGGDGQSASLLTEGEEPAEAETLSALEAGTLAELKSALRSAGDGDVVSLTADITVDSQVSVGAAAAKNVTISGANPAGPNFSLVRGGSYAGYLIRIDNGNGLALENVTLDGANIASARAHVYLTSGSLALKSGSILQNSNSVGGGGAVTAIGGSVTVGSGAVVQNNYAAGNGGGINMTAGSLVLESGSLIQGNQAGGDGGGVNLYTGAGGSSPVAFSMASGATVTGNRAANGGGVVVRLATASDAVSVAGSISGNTATNHGGGLYLNVRNGSVPPVALSGTTLAGNTAGGAGGGLYVADSNPTGSLSLGGLAVTDNSAKDGGGIFVYHRDAAVSHTMSVAGTTVSGNVASGLGGGVYLASEGTLSATFSQTSIQNNQAASQGGGLWVIGRGSGAAHTVSLDDGSTVTGNSSDIAGGVYFRAANGESTLSLSGQAKVDANVAATAAGGVRLQGADGSPMKMSVENASVSSNRQTGTSSDSGGGGIMLNGAELTLGAGAAVSDNTATMRGGGVFSSKSSTITEAGSAVSRNTAAQNGGGFYLAGGSSLTVEPGGSVADNGAVNGGGAFGMGASVDIGGSVSGNTASSRGGGIHLTNQGRLDVRAGAAVDGNAAQEGGGIALSVFSEGTIAGSVSDNRADLRGGGVFYGWPWNSSDTVSATDLLLEGTATVARNTAQNGGGIYAAGAGNGGLTDTRMTVDGAAIEGNDASAKGGGVYVEKATLDMESGSLTGNVSGENRGHDLWVDPEQSVGSPSEGGAVNLRVDETAFTADPDRDKVLIGAGSSGTVNFLQDFTMKNHLLLQSTATDRSTATVAAGAELALSGKLTVGVDGGSSNHVLVVDPNGGSVLYKNDAEASGADPLTGDVVSDMYAFPGSSATVYLQWPGQAPDRADEPFKGWSDDGSALANRGAEYLTLESDAAVAAQWGAYTIRYFDEDGVTSLDSLEPSGYAYGTDTTTLPEPSKEGYRFVAWYEHADHSGTPVASFANADREDKAYYAKWEEAPAPPGPVPPDPGPTPDPTPDPVPDPKPSSDPSSASGSSAGRGASLAVTGDSLVGLGALGIVLVLAGAAVFVARRNSEN